MCCVPWTLLCRRLPIQLHYVTEVSFVSWQTLAYLSCRSDTRCVAVSNHYSHSHHWSFAVAGSRIWNSLPTSLHSVDLSIKRFKRALRTFLFVWDRGKSVTLFKACRIWIFGQTYIHTYIHTCLLALDAIVPVNSEVHGVLERQCFFNMLPMTSSPKDN